MSEVGEALKIVNTTPLTMTANGEPVRPFQPLECRWVDGQIMLNTGGGGRREAAPISIGKISGKAPLAIDLIYLRTHFCKKLDTYLIQATRESINGPDDQHLRLKVTNQTKSHALVYLLGPKEGEDAHLFTMAPGESANLLSQNGFFWLFRDQMGEILGMVEAAKEPPQGWNTEQKLASPYYRIPFDPYTITDGFAQAARAYDQTARGGVAVKVLGERRKSTPPPPDDPLFVSTATVGWGIPTRLLGTLEQAEPFNGLTNRVVRDVQIAGPLLRWNGENTLLKEYYGGNVADVRNLTICADHMIVEDGLHFPRTNVTIYARKLTFADGGSIHTTPLPHPHKAKSEYVTVNADDPSLAGIPADAEGNPTYRGADGRNGEPAGAIHLIVPEVEVNVQDPRRVLNALGSAGQDGEDGGLRPYAPLTPDEPPTFMELPHCTMDDIMAGIKRSKPGRLDDYVWGRNAAKSLDAATVEIAGRDVPIPLGSIVSWEIWMVNTQGSVDINLNPSYFGSRIRSSDPVSLSYSYVENKEEIFYENKGRKACNGRGGYPGGWPGDGGDGGTIVFRFRGARVEPWQCGVSAGRHGNPTEPVKGGPPPGPNPAYHLRLIGYRREYEERAGGGAHEKKFLAKSALIDVSGKPGFPSPPGWLVTGDGRDVSSLPKLYGERAGKSKKGEIRYDERDDDLSWMHPAALSATLDYARMSFRNGFREEAGAAIYPYYQIATSERKKQASLECQALLETVVHLQSKLVQNLDYYGNPPGWVPRLDALSNLATLKEVFEASYATYYFADKLLRDYEMLEDQRAVSAKMSDALNHESAKAAKLLNEAYQKLPLARRELSDVASRTSGVKTAIEDVEKAAKEQAKDEVQVQRFFSGMMRLAGGIAQSLPVAQPFLGLGGSALASASMFDYTAEDPFASGQTALTSLESSVNTWVEKKSEAVTTAVTAGLDDAVGAQQSLIKQLTVQVANDEKAETATFAAAETSWEDFRKAELAKIEGQIANITAEIEKKEKDKPTSMNIRLVTGLSSKDIALATGLQDQLMRQKALLFDKRLKPLEQRLAEYFRQQAELVAAATPLKRSGNETLKTEAENSKPHKNMLIVKEKLAAAELALERVKTKAEARKTKATTLMSNLSDLGTGLSNVGNAVLSMAKPIAADDPALKRLTDQILVKDPYLNAKGRQLTSALMTLLEEKKNKVTQLVRWQSQANTCLSAITTNMATLTALSSQRQSLSRALDPAVKSYLRQARRRAEDALGESIYWFVKACQYEYLTDVDDTFYNLDTWAKRIEAFEVEKSMKDGGEGSPNTGRVILDQLDFKRIGKEVFTAEQTNLGQNLLRERQKSAPNPKGKYEDCVLQRGDEKQTELLDALAQGECLFRFVEDFGKGSLAWNDARVVDVDLVALRIDTDKGDRTLTFRIEQVGDMEITKRTSNGRERFIFRHGRDDEPIGWQFNYNHKDGMGTIVRSDIELDKLSEAVENLISPALKGLKDYRPALFSNYRIRITDLPKYEGFQLKIDRLIMNVQLSSATS